MSILDAVLGRIPDQALITLNTVELVAIVYLALAVSKLRERIARMEGEHEREREHDRDRDRE